MPGMGRIFVAGLGPGELPILDPRIWQILSEVSVVAFRTKVHPNVDSVMRDLETANPKVTFLSFDDLYDKEDSFESVYQEIARQLGEISRSGSVLYLVPGSPWVAETSVELVRKTHGRSVEILQGVSFLELVWGKLGIDPLANGITIIDALDFSTLSKLHQGPYLLTQVWSKQILSEVKLAVDEPLDATAVVLKALGTRSESVKEVAWNDLDKEVDPDHLTSLYIPKVPASPGPELMELFDIIARLRLECPWDREQTHQSLVRHLVEESYEVIDAIEKLDQSPDGDLQPVFEEIKGELGDLLVQVYFHSNLASEEGMFNLGNVAQTVSQKLIRRHPHVFAELSVDNADQVVNNWEVIKQSEEGRTSILDGIPTTMPSLLLASKLLRKGTAVGLGIPDSLYCVEQLENVFLGLKSRIASGDKHLEDEFAELLWWLVALAKNSGIDLEDVLRARSKLHMQAMRDAEITFG